MTTVFHRCRFGLAGIVLALLCACGGGGGGDSGGGGGTTPANAPLIYANLISLPPNGAITKPDSVTTNSAAVVQVYDNTTSVSITTATVTMNGTGLPYVASGDDYEAQITVQPGEDVSVSVRWNGHTYQASMHQLSAFPTVIAPTVGATWAASESNLVSWTATAPSSTAYYLSGVFDTTGELLWPSGGLQQYDTATTAYGVPENSLTPGDREVLVGMFDGKAFTGAAPGSSLAVGGFDLVPIHVNAFNGVPVSLTLTPTAATVGVGGTQQFTVTGQFSDGNSHDLTLASDWFSGSPAFASVDNHGLVTGIAPGSSEINVRYGVFSNHAPVTVFAPTLSPAPPLSSSVTWQVDYAHSGRATVGAGGPVFPPTGGWAVTLNGRVSYPVVADGKVFVTTGTDLANPSGQGGTLYALDDASGSIAWGPIDLPGSYGFSAHAYDHGKLFVVNFDGQIRAMDAATGFPRWTTQVENWLVSAPTAANGVLYVGGGILNGIDESNGNRFWRAYVSGSAFSSPTVSDDGVFVSYPCQVYKFERFSNRNLWHYDGGCSGGGGATSVYGNGRLYVRDTFNNQIFDAATGTLLGTFVTRTIPAITSDAGYFLTFDANNHGVLKATDLATQAVRWSFTGDDQLITAPLVVDNFVIIGSSTGMIFALKVSDGSVVWSAMTAAPFEVPGEGGLGGPLSGFGVGDGYLFAPAGNTLNAWKIVH